jgi:hypothetical protein
LLQSYIYFRSVSAEGIVILPLGDLPTIAAILQLESCPDLFELGEKMEVSNDGCRSQRFSPGDKSCGYSISTRTAMTWRMQLAIQDAKRRLEGGCF